jgi:hypothetical protein
MYYDKEWDISSHHRPIRPASTNIDHKTSDDLFTKGSMCDFWMELDTVEWFRVMCYCGERRCFCGANGVEIGWNC